MLPLLLAAVAVVGAELPAVRCFLQDGLSEAHAQVRVAERVRVAYSPAEGDSPASEAAAVDQGKNPTSMPPDEAAPMPSASPASAPQEYLIGADDMLKIVVYGNEDLTQVVVVQADGSFTFPLVGRVAAAGLTPQALGTELAEMLSNGFVRNPQISVVVQEFRSKSVFVVGEVLKPGSYPIHGSMSVVEVVARAAPTANAGTEIVIVRPVGPATGPILPDEVAVAGASDVPSAGAARAEVLRLDLREIQMGNVDQNVILKPNDTVFVKQAARVFVSGEVRNPGSYIYTPGLTARQAVSLAGGFTPDASTRRVRVIRDTERRPKDELKLGLEAPLQPGDTIIVKAKLF
jgi:polysaccharide export outer membrane protein